MQELRGWLYPVTILYTSNPKVWAKEVAKNKWIMPNGEPVPFPEGANTTEGTREGGGDVIAVMLNRDHFEEDDEVGPIALLAHETVHVKQAIQRCLSEREGFSSEAEAYLVQFILQWLIEQYNAGK